MINMNKIDASVKGAIATALIGLFVWCFNMNADVKINTTNINHNKERQTEQHKQYMEATKELTKAVNELRVVIAKMDRGI